ncbi:MAG: hypothetical protein AMXMBFR7_05620 [Planctomycetota bacterium]
MRSILFVLLSIAAASYAGEPAARFAPHPKLAGLAEKSALLASEGYKGDGNVLDFSGIVYDPHRHRFYAFGGGHATRKFPNSVHEFDPATLQWSELSPDISPKEYTRENALFDAEKKPLGGLRYQGKIYASSRHTYDGLVVPPNQSLMICTQLVGEIGGSYLDGTVYKECYKGSGLWTFDPVKREWSVSKKAGLAMNHVGSAVWPKEPDWIYFYAQTGTFRAVNWKTEEVRDLGKIPKGLPYSYAGLEYFPDEEALVALPRGPKETPQNKLFCKYDLKSGQWTTVETQGEAPATHDCNAVYDPRNRVFVVFAEGDFFYFSPRDNRWYKTGSNAEALVGEKMIRHRHDYDPVNNVHLIVGRGWKTVAFKLSDTPGSLPGTAK